MVEYLLSCSVLSLCLLFFLLNLWMNIDFFLFVFSQGPSRASSVIEGREGSVRMYLFEQKTNECTIWKLYLAIDILENPATGNEGIGKDSLLLFGSNWFVLFCVLQKIPMEIYRLLNRINRQRKYSLIDIDSEKYIFNLLI